MRSQKTFGDGFVDVRLFFGFLSYEIQVAEQGRRQGLGKFLMQVCARGARFQLVISGRARCKRMHRCLRNAPRRIKRGACIGARIDLAHMHPFSPSQVVEAIGARANMQRVMLTVFDGARWRGQPHPGVELPCG